MFATKALCEGVSNTKSIERETELGKELNGSLRRVAIDTGVTFLERLAQDILGVLQGDSQALRKKVEQHEFATVNRFVVYLCVNLRIRPHVH
jgi:hypothetical protein